MTTNPLVTEKEPRFWLSRNLCSRNRKVPATGTAEQGSRGLEGNPETRSGHIHQPPRGAPTATAQGHRPGGTQMPTAESWNEAQESPALHTRSFRKSPHSSTRIPSVTRRIGPSNSRAAPPSGKQTPEPERPPPCSHRTPASSQCPCITRSIGPDVMCPHPSAYCPQGVTEAWGTGRTDPGASWLPLRLQGAQTARTRQDCQGKWGACHTGRRWGQPKAPPAPGFPTPNCPPREAAWPCSTDHSTRGPQGGVSQGHRSVPS